MGPRFRRPRRHCKTAFQMERCWNDELLRAIHTVFHFAARNDFFPFSVFLHAHVHCMLKFPSRASWSKTLTSVRICTPISCCRMSPKMI